MPAGTPVEPRPWLPERVGHVTGGEIGRLTEALERARDRLGGAERALFDVRERVRHFQAVIAGAGFDSDFHDLAAAQAGFGVMERLEAARQGDVRDASENVHLLERHRAERWSVYGRLRDRLEGRLVLDDRDLPRDPTICRARVRELVGDGPAEAEA
jgi:hypothetical protein